MFNSYTYNGVKYNSVQLLLIEIPITGNTGAGFVRKRRPRTNILRLELDVYAVRYFKLNKDYTLLGTILKYLASNYSVVGSVLSKIHASYLVLGETLKDTFLNANVLGSIERKKTLLSKVMGTVSSNFEYKGKTLGKREFVLSNTKTLTGTKFLNYKDKMEVRGKKNISSILVALDIFN